MAVCVAIINKENSPLLLKWRDGESEEEVLKLHYTVHSSLDIVEDRINGAPTSGGRGGELRELYLGLLLSTEDYRVYGYASNTRIKFIVVVELGNQLKDQDLRSLFKRLHSAFCDAVSSPFYEVNSTLRNSKSLSRFVAQLMKN